MKGARAGRAGAVLVNTSGLVVIKTLRLSPLHSLPMTHFHTATTTTKVST